MVYFAYFHSVWNNLGKFNKCAPSIIKKKKKRGNGWCGTRSSCRELFRKLKILPPPCQYILSLMLFLIDNLKDFPTNAYVHSLDTRNKNQLRLPTVSLACVQRGVSYSGVKKSLIAFQAIYRVIEITERNLKTSYTSLITHSFDSVTEFLECKIDMDNM
jgi:hypothetical protein